MLLLPLLTRKTSKHIFWNNVANRFEEAKQPVDEGTINFEKNSGVPLKN